MYMKFASILPSITGLLLACGMLVACTAVPSHMDQMSLINTAVRDRAMLVDMYADDYFPKHLVDECKGILVSMCHRIETEKPADLPALYTITHDATELLNQLQPAFEENDSELETGAREALGEEFDVIARAYGFDADVEEMMAPREW